MPFVSIPAKSALIRYSFHQGKNTTFIPFRIICYQDLMMSSNGLCPGVKPEPVFLTLPMKKQAHAGGARCHAWSAHPAKRKIRIGGWG
jgi:hypothetical protein